MTGAKDGDEDLSPEEVSELLDQLLGRVADASKAASDDLVEEKKPADKLKTPQRRTQVPKVGRPRRK